TLGVAVEAYTVDWDRPPLDYAEWEARFRVPQWQRQYCYRQLTTPVAYITSWLSDPFARFPKIDTDGRSSREEMAYYVYQNYVPDRAAGSPTLAIQRAFARGYIWGFYSVGPIPMSITPWFSEMLGRTVPVADSLGCIYDPTNGTVSRGRIHRTNKGILTASELAL
ncbi:hypothetical protein FJY63_12365, partial [Candidatus Sumerlaeota bacterium]|nr:hypothetical protein [Candidatus Sumerlaeota bacterium]